MRLARAASPAGVIVAGTLLAAGAGTAGNGEPVLKTVRATGGSAGFIEG